MAEGLRAYLDHASSTPLRPVALAAMLPFLAGHPGDPGRLHAEGRRARVAIEEAREQVASLFGARPREVVFTSNGTEAINAAVFGALARGGDRVRGGDRTTGRSHAVSTPVEHSAVLEALRKEGAETSVSAVDRLGRYGAQDVLALLRADTRLVSVQLANHEVGTVQPVAEVVAGCRERGVLVHVDACAAAGHLPISFSGLGADLVSVTGHKLGGPRGAAALLVRRGLRIPPLLVGGAQERARRGGIEDVAAIVGFGAAAAELDDGGRLGEEAAASRSLTDRLLIRATECIEGVDIYGDRHNRLPHLVCIGVAGVEAEPVLLALDQRGVAVHSGSACSSETFEPSPVLAAMGVDADHSLRASVGWPSTPQEVELFLEALGDVVPRLRALRTA